LIRHANRGGCLNPAKFPVNSLLIAFIREFEAETCSITTASSARQSGLHELTCELGSS
jgi:hypothetical protein